ncbi:MAG: flagellar hook-basal body complex protein [Desulfovibrio sp.]|jgi:flagellar hook protein FlgE|nr:flagellar hook-basal body complex protein [Desulfovibrio sp.]
MSLSASMWTSVSGLLAHGDKMNVVGNNIANVSTIGFKGQRMDFNDYLYIDRGSTSGPTQIGEGVSIYAVLGDFSQGSMQSTNSATDLAINGNGFFGVRKPNSEELYYTRAGDFYFNEERELVNPEMYKVQGYKVDNKKQVMFNTGAAIRASKDENPYVGQGAPTDIVLDSWYLIPQRTTNVTVANQLLIEDIQDKTVDNASPMTALFNLWNAQNTQKTPPDPPLPEQAYATQSTLKVYDEGGSKHDLTIYFDKVNTPVYNTSTTPATPVYEVQGLPAGYTMYEYLVTIPPSEDMRSYGGTYDPATEQFVPPPAPPSVPFYDPSGTNTHKKAGILMSGVMIFNGSGQLVNQTAYTFGGQYPGGAAVNAQYPHSPDLPDSWEPTKFSNNGLPVFTANFSGQPLANSVGEMMQGTGGPPPFSQAQNYIVELDFGLTNAGGSWNNTGKTLADLKVIDLPVPGYTTTVQVGSTNYTIKSTVTAGPGTYAPTPSSTAGSYATVYYDGTNVIAASWDDDGTGTISNLVVFAIPGADVTSPSPASLPIAPSPVIGSGAASTGPATKPVIPYTTDVATMQSAERKDSASFATGTGTFITNVDQDGYASGVLNGYNIDSNGVLYGRYSNNITLALWQITMYDFRNLQGLRREGGNLYAETMASGNALVGVAGHTGFGSVESYNIEQSNVDIAREFVEMISTQRGFQANSKGITTVDTMLETVIGMKR